MSEKSKTADRETLARVAALLRPALATRDYIPALTHIRFAAGEATAFNDVAAIWVVCPAPVERCVPGELLIKALTSFGGSEVLFQEGKDGSLTLKSGRGTVKLPTLGADAFPFKRPAADEGTEVDLVPSVVRGVERCLLSVGSDPRHPAQMGVTLESEGGLAVLYSTDNYTMSRCETEAKMKLPGDAPVILPRFFCEQLISLTKAFPEERATLVLHGGALHAELGDKAGILTRTPVDVTPLDFPRIVSRHVDLGKLRGTMAVIPDAFDAALGRAAMVLAGEVSKRTRARLDGDGLRLSSSCAAGESDDEMPFAGTKGLEFLMDPVMVARGAKACALVAFTDRVTAMADADCKFVHLVAHTADV